jgi:integrase
MRAGKSGGQLEVRTVGVLVPFEVVQNARGFAAESRAQATRDAYASDWRIFKAWADGASLATLPAEPATVALYLSALATAGRKASTIGRALVSISQAHKAAGLPSPRASLAVQEVVKGIRRTLGTAAAQKAPVLVDNLRAMVAQLPGGLLGARDRALLLVGFAGGFRRSELAALDVADVAFVRDGAEVTIRRSKTDQEGHGRKLPICYGGNPATCPVRALQAWLELAAMKEGPIFRGVNRHGQIGAGRLTPRVVRLVVRRSAARAGLDAAKYGGHSLRAGLVTEAAKHGKRRSKIMQATGHRSEAMLQRYERDADLFTDAANAGLGL